MAPVTLLADASKVLASNKSEKSIPRDSTSMLFRRFPNFSRATVQSSFFRSSNSLPSKEELCFTNVLSETCEARALSSAIFFSNPLIAAWPPATPSAVIPFFPAASIICLITSSSAT